MSVRTPPGESVLRLPSAARAGPSPPARSSAPAKWGRRAAPNPRASVAGRIHVVTRPAPVRWIIAVSVAFGLQFCCCNLEAVFQVCTACADHSAPASADHAHNQDELSGEHHSHEHATASEDQHDPLPCDEHHEHGECKCGSHNMAKSLPEKPRLELPVLTLIAVLSEPEFKASEFDSCLSSLNLNEGVFRPPTSLLRQHCALTV